MYIPDRCIGPQPWRAFVPDAGRRFWMVYGTSPAEIVRIRRLTALFARRTTLLRRRNERRTMTRSTKAVDNTLSATPCTRGCGDNGRWTKTRGYIGQLPPCELATQFPSPLPPSLPLSSRLLLTLHSFARSGSELNQTLNHSLFDLIVITTWLSVSASSPSLSLPSSNLSLPQESLRVCDYCLSRTKPRSTKHIAYSR